MKGTDPTTVSVTCSDEYVRDLYDSADPVLRTHLTSEQTSESTNGIDIDVSFPVEDSTRLPYKTTIELQLSTADETPNLKSVYNSARSDSLSDKEIFDISIIKTLGRAFRAEKTSIEEASICNEKLRSLVLHEVWGMDSWPRLQRHLEQSDPVSRAIGYQTVPNQSTFYRAAKSCDFYPDIIEQVATRAVHVAVRHDIEIPTEVDKKYRLASLAAIDEGSIPWDLEKRVLVNWVDYLLAELLEGEIFGRAENRKYSPKQILGGLTQAAYVGSFNAIQRAGCWHYTVEEIPTPSHVRELICDMDTNEISAIFDKINTRFIELATHLGFYSKPYTYAFDTTWIDAGDHQEEELTGTISNPKGGETGEGWLFAAINTVNLDARFTPGISLIRDKSEKSNQLRRLLRVVSQSKSIKRVLADRGFYESDAVKACRDACGRNWIIRAQHKQQGEVAEYIDNTPEGVSEFYPDVEFASIMPKPNLFVHYVPEDAQKWAGGTHVGFLTDLSPELINIDSVFHIYRNRWSIETFNRQLKNDFNVPTKSSSQLIRFFLLQIQTFVYNIHTLINRALSPKLAIPLDVTYDQVLKAITESAFTRIAGRGY